MLFSAKKHAERLGCKAIKYLITIDIKELIIPESILLKEDLFKSSNDNTLTLSLCFERGGKISATHNILLKKELFTISNPDYYNQRLTLSIHESLELIATLYQDSTTNKWQKKSGKLLLRRLKQNNKFHVDSYEGLDRQEMKLHELIEEIEHNFNGYIDKEIVFSMVMGIKAKVRIYAKICKTIDGNQMNDDSISILSEQSEKSTVTIGAIFPSMRFSSNNNSASLTPLHLPTVLTSAPGGVGFSSSSDTDNYASDAYPTSSSTASILPTPPSPGAMASTKPFVTTPAQPPSASQSSSSSSASSFSPFRNFLHFNKKKPELPSNNKSEDRSKNSQRLSVEPDEEDDEGAKNSDEDLDDFMLTLSPMPQAMKERYRKERKENKDISSAIQSPSLIINHEAFTYYRKELRQKKQYIHTLEQQLQEIQQQHLFQTKEYEEEIISLQKKLRDEEYVRHELISFTNKTDQELAKLLADSKAQTNNVTDEYEKLSLDYQNILQELETLKESNQQLQDKNEKEMIASQEAATIAVKACLKRAQLFEENETLLTELIDMKVQFANLSMDLDYEKKKTLTLTRNIQKYAEKLASLEVKYIQKLGETQKDNESVDEETI